MILEMTFTIGNIFTLITLIITLGVFIWKIGRFTSSMERRMDKLDSTIINQTDSILRVETITKAEVLRVETVTKSDIARLEALDEKCYTKVKIKEHDFKIVELGNNQIELRAQLPLQLEAIRKEIGDLSNEIKELRTDIANRRKEDHG